MSIKKPRLEPQEGKEPVGPQPLIRIFVLTGTKFAGATESIAVETCCCSLIMTTSADMSNQARMLKGRDSASVGRWPLGINHGSALARQTWLREGSDKNGAEKPWIWLPEPSVCLPDTKTRGSKECNASIQSLHLI
jgi:hypothetical protein